MNEEIRLMQASYQFEISRIKAQMLADVTIRILEKYDFVTNIDVEEIATKARYLVLLAFNEQCNEEGGKE